MSSIYRFDGVLISDSHYFGNFEQTCTQEIREICFNKAKLKNQKFKKWLSSVHYISGTGKHFPLCFFLECSGLQSLDVLMYLVKH